MQPREQLKQYLYLMRFHRPIGLLLLLWPTLWALWLASNGSPEPQLLIVFIVGVILMRAGGCIVNDLADRHLDPHVKRTQDRPLASNKVSVREALILALILGALSFCLVIWACNLFTIELAILAVGIVVVYPFLKRVTHLPQLGLGVAFAWGVPMAFAAERNHIGTDGWFLFVTAMVWPIIYDTMYAMMDREDDLKIGIKSAAILFAQMDRLIIGLLQVLFITMMIIVGLMFHLHVTFYLALLLVSILFIYQQWLISFADSQMCYRAFRNHHWVGLIIFLGIVFSYIYPVHIDSLMRGVSTPESANHQGHKEWPINLTAITKRENT